MNPQFQRELIEPDGWIINGELGPARRARSSPTGGGHRHRAGPLNRALRLPGTAAIAPAPRFLAVAVELSEQKPSPRPNSNRHPRPDGRAARPAYPFGCRALHRLCRAGVANRVGKMTERPVPQPAGVCHGAAAPVPQSRRARLPAETSVRERLQQHPNARADHRVRNRAGVSWTRRPAPRIRHERVRRLRSWRWAVRLPCSPREGELLPARARCSSCQESGRLATCSRPSETSRCAQQGLRWPGCTLGFLRGPGARCSSAAGCSDRG